MAYRGRALVELNTAVTDEDIKKPVSPLAEEDIVAVQV